MAAAYHSQPGSNTGAGARLSAGALGRRAARLNGGKLESPVEAASDSPSELPAGLGASVTVTQLSLPAAARPGRACQ